MSVGPIIRLRFGRPGTHGLPRHIAGLRVIAVVAGITANAASPASPVSTAIRFRSGLVQLVRLSLNSRGLPRLRQLTPRSPGLVRRLAAGSVGTVSIFSAISRARLTRLGLSRVRLSRGGRLGGHRALHGFIRPFGLARLVRLARLIDYGNRPRPDGPIPHDIDYRSPSALLRPPSLHRTLINEGDHGYVFSPLLIGRGQCAAVADVGLELLEVVLR